MRRWMLLWGKDGLLKSILGCLLASGEAICRGSRARVTQVILQSSKYDISLEPYFYMPH